MEHHDGSQVDRQKTGDPDRRYSIIAWGLILIWLGIRNVFVSLPDGTGLLGVGLILLGINAARSFQGVPPKAFTTLLGALALLWGGLELANSTLSLPFELPALPILLIIAGAFLLLSRRATRRITICCS